jgi:prolyl-tRNA editing enzyme YbaK/EbsC (Cys-tRNA(Pro) deacylase)
MSVASVRAYFEQHSPAIKILELDVSTATVELAAAGHNVEPGQIAKTLAIRLGEEIVLIVTKGTARLDNKKFKAQFATKPRMLGLDEVERETGHPVGGVCPFGLLKPMKIYCDVSMQAYDEVVPAAGGTKAAVRIPPLHMAELTGAEWIDVCQ